ncbi:MAG TPA: carbohydrate-binding protein, partial [Burkholderiales bacterium]|nr:carbohydrate-binding protein [Burkholderiales bacterium]
PVARTVVVPGGTSTLRITEGGTASGYVLYTAAAGGAVLDAGNATAHNVTIAAPYVIVRGLTLKGAQQDAIRLLPGARDVVIEDNDISGWGRQRSGTLGVNLDSGIRAVCSDTSLRRVVIQRNRIHHPRYGTNSWSSGHPEGPQGITFSHCAGNHVIRYNEITSAEGQYFNDGIGGEDNFTTVGFPNHDTDVYGNVISHAWDDAIEAEGANRNVRIWGNYLDRTAVGVATTLTSIGPVYIFRNVQNRSRHFSHVAPDSDQRNVFSKSGSTSLGGGRRYVLHNTLLQASEPGSLYGLGAGHAIGGTGSTQPVTNTVSRNNIFHIWKPSSTEFYQLGSGNDFGYDLYNGSLNGAVELNGIAGLPIYAAGNGWTNEAGGQYALASGSPGYDAGQRIANFNDAFTGNAPDVGAHEAGTAAMRLGTGTAPSPAAPTPEPTPPAAGASTPYFGTPIVIPATIEAENFDKGGEGVAYHDNLKGNAGGQYRTSEDVDIIASADSAGGGYVVYNFETGEWMKYTITVPVAGNFNLALRVSSSFATSAFHVEIDGVDVTGRIAVPSTGSWSAFQWITAKAGLALSAGTHVLKVVADQQYFNLNSVRLAP